MKTIYEQALDLGVEVGHWQTDLYLPVTEATKELIDGYKFKGNVRTFRSETDGGLWFDVPFAFDPGWPTPTQNGIR